jgi:hypothetical protein
MIRPNFLIAGIVLVALGISARAAEPGTLFAEGAWSKAVNSGNGDALRARLVLYEHAVTVGGRADFPRQQRRAVSVYVELQDARDAVAPAMRVYCDFVNNLRCTLVDKDGKQVPVIPGAFGGGVPQPEWVSLPAEATIRLRSSPFGLHRENAVVISPTIQGGWEIKDDDPNEYFLSATFTAAAEKLPAEKPDAGAPPRVWHGTLERPAVRVASPAASDPIAALAAKLAGSHGLWLNGPSPILNAPPDAPAEQVAAEVFEKTTPPEGKVTKFEVIEQRDAVTISTLPDRRLGRQEQYTAVRVRTNVGEKIVLIQGPGTGWWSRIYDGK